MKLLIYIAFLVLISSCRKDPIIPEQGTTPYNFIIPYGFSTPIFPSDNPMTEEGVELGRHLFYEERLSSNNLISCASCHFPKKSFSDTIALSLGVQGLDGKRNAMPLFNLAWSPTFFWDGRSSTLEAQIFEPVKDPLEMHQLWPAVVTKIKQSGDYDQMFMDAFGDTEIDSTRISKALAQFVRSIVSADSPFDRYLRTGNIGELGPDFNNILAGQKVFSNKSQGDCVHCHLDPQDDPLVTHFLFRNNGLDLSPVDSGYGKVTLSPFDNFKFKTPSLRNLVFTGPYMHDGRFQTIDEVLDFYNFDVQESPNISIEMYQDEDSTNIGSPGAINLTPLQKIQLKAFLLSLTDSTLMTNPAYQDPNP